MEVYGMTYDGDCAIETNAITSFVYVHGDLDDDIGNDLVWIPNYIKANDISEGIYDVDFIYPQGKRIKAKLYVWADKHGHSHGLCCDVLDEEANIDAQCKFDKKHYTTNGWFMHEGYMVSTEWDV